MADTKIAHHWAPITDLGDADIAAASTELPYLLRTWEEVRQDLPEQQVRDFNERLQREWAIETGIIERLYTLDAGTTSMLIEQGIDASLIPHDNKNDLPEVVAGMITDHLDAVHWLVDVITQQRPLSTSFIKQLHQLMTRKQTHATGVDQFGQDTKIKLRHGAYKEMDNNPTKASGKLHQYCPPAHVAMEMDQLIALNNQHIRDEVAPDVAAAWLHHRFVQIHPFQDGNGRVARALASLVLIRGGLFPLVVTRRDRKDYLKALNTADGGNMQPLIALIVKLQKKWLIQAIGITSAVKRDAEHLDQMLESIGEIFQRRDREELDTAKTIASTLLKDANKHFGEVAYRLREQISSKEFRRKVFNHNSDNDTELRSHYRYPVVNTAKRLDYYANMREYHAWARLVIEIEQGRSEVLLSFHGINRDYRGLIAASMCFYRRHSDDTNAPHIIELHPVSEDLFQINYCEDVESVRQRFQPWLKGSMLKALDRFRRGE